MSALLQEIVSVYPLLAPPSLTAHASNRVCNALALLQCVASHNDTRSLFLSAHIPLFLYPFLNTTSKTRPFEYLRLTSLGVIGALVKQNDNSDVINFLLSTEIIPLCLRIMETGSELSKTVAIFIVQKILLDEVGLGYICQTYERFYAVGTVLSNMVQQLVETQAVRLLKHVVRCYLRLSDNLRRVSSLSPSRTNRECRADSGFLPRAQRPRGPSRLPPRTAARRHVLAAPQGRHGHQAVPRDAPPQPLGPRRTQLDSARAPRRRPKPPSPLPPPPRHPRLASAPSRPPSVVRRSPSTYTIRPFLSSPSLHGDDAPIPSSSRPRYPHSSSLRGSPPQLALSPPPSLLYQPTPSVSHPAAKLERPARPAPTPSPPSSLLLSRSPQDVVRGVCLSLSPCVVVSTTTPPPSTVLVCTPSARKAGCAPSFAVVVVVLESSRGWLERVREGDELDCDSFVKMCYARSDNLRGNEPFPSSPATSRSTGSPPRSSPASLSAPPPSVLSSP